MRDHALRVDPLDGGANGAGKVVGALERLMGQVMALEVAPGALDVVQLRRIPRQPLDGDPGPFGQRCP